MRSITNSLDSVWNYRIKKVTLLHRCILVALFWLLSRHSHENRGSSSTSGRPRPTSAHKTCAVWWRGETLEHAKPVQLDSTETSQPLDLTWSLFLSEKWDITTPWALLIGRCILSSSFGSSCWFHIKCAICTPIGHRGEMNGLVVIYSTSFGTMISNCSYGQQTWGLLTEWCISFIALFLWNFIKCSPKCFQQEKISIIDKKEIVVKYYTIQTFKTWQ